MQWRRTAYFTHRWLGAIVALQLLAWSAGGLLFSVLDIDDVHGDLDRVTTPPAPLEVAPPVALDAALRRAGQSTRSKIAKLVLRRRHDGPVYECFDADDRALGAVHAETGAWIGSVSREQAIAIARADFRHAASVRTVELIDRDPPLEARGRPLPLWQIVFEHAKEPHIYVSAITGAVLARRNAPWRLFDFFWMLHIMDYSEREDFNHPLLTAFSALAVLTALSGLVLQVWRFARRRKDRAARVNRAADEARSR